MHNIKQIVIIIISAAILTSCGKTFTVEGMMTDAPDGAEYIYLEYIGLIQATRLDSAKASKGSFKLKSKAPECPDLYRLRCGTKNIILSIDSTDHIKISGSWQDILSATINGSAESEQIQLLRRSLRDSTLDAHKAFAVEQILLNPASPAAYYALYQSKGGKAVFDINNRQDRQIFQAVATSWMVWYPDSKCTKILYQQVLDAINTERREHNNNIMRTFIEESETTFLDIDLPDENGENRLLSDLQGKVILLDFCSTELDGYQDYIFALRDRYNAYHTKGLEIYQVYPDRNRLLWEDQVENLPWVTVRTDNGVADAVFRTYNVTNVPTLFILNRKGEVEARCTNLSTLNEQIEKLL